MKPLDTSDIAAIIKIWRAGKIYLLTDASKLKARATVARELAREDISQAQRTTLEILENVLLG